MSNASIQNIGYFVDTKLGWYHLNITIDTKNIVTSMLREAKESYFKNKFNVAIIDTRNIWNLLNDLVSSGR